MRAVQRYDVDIELQKGSKWASHGNLGERNTIQNNKNNNNNNNKTATTILATTRATTTIATMMLISIYKRA